MTDVWAYRDSSWTESQGLVGYDVEARDGPIGNVAQSVYDASDAFVVVDTGEWILGEKRLIPAGAVVSVDHDGKTVHVAMTKDEVRSAPAHEDRWDDAVRSRHTDYYASLVR